VRRDLHPRRLHLERRLVVGLGGLAGRPEQDADVDGDLVVVGELEARLGRPAHHHVAEHEAVLVLGVHAHAHHARVQRPQVGYDRVLFEDVERVGDSGMGCLGGERVDDAVGVLEHVAVGDVEAELLLEAARLLGRALDGDDLVAVGQDDGEGGRDGEDADLQAALVLDVVPARRKGS